MGESPRRERKEDLIQEGKLQVSLPQAQHLNFFRIAMKNN